MAPLGERVKRCCLLLAAVLTIAACGRDPGPSTLSSVVVTGDSTVGLNGTLQLSATALAGNRPLTTGLTFVWTSSDTTRVRVSQTGLVTGVQLGSATITVSAVPQTGTLVTSDPHVIRPRIARIVFRPFDISLASRHDTVILVADARDAQGTSVSGLGFTWVSRDTGIVTVADSGPHKAIVAAVGYGTTHVVATVDRVSDSVTATVNQVPKTVQISPANFGTPDVTMTTNQSAPFFAAVFDSLDHPALADSVVWTSSDSTRASPAATVTLDSTVITTFALTGATTITATAGLASATRVVNVSATPISFATDVQAIFNTSTPPCTNCHPSAAGMDLRAGSSYASIVDQNASEVPAMKRVRPFMPDSSYLIHKIQGTQNTVGGTGARMPLGCSGNGCLPNASINIIRNWILQGALQN